MTDIIVSFDSGSNPDRVAARIEQALSMLGHGSSAEVYSGIDRDDWTVDDPCPECGAENFAVSHVDWSVADRNFDTIEWLHGADIPNLAIECEECGEVLYRHPIHERF